MLISVTVTVVLNARVAFVHVWMFVLKIILRGHNVATMFWLEGSLQNAYRMLTAGGIHLLSGPDRWGGEADFTIPTALAEMFGGFSIHWHHLFFLSPWLWSDLETNCGFSWSSYTPFLWFFCIPTTVIRYLYDFWTYTRRVICPFFLAVSLNSFTPWQRRSTRQTAVAYKPYSRPQESSTRGIQDIAAILPLFGHMDILTQQVTPMSIFGSLGMVSAGFKTLVTCFSLGGIEGAKILGNMGFEPQGENLSLIMVGAGKGKNAGRY